MWVGAGRIRFPGRWATLGSEGVRLIYLSLTDVQNSRADILRDRARARDLGAQALIVAAGWYPATRRRAELDPPALARLQRAARIRRQRQITRMH